MQIYNLFSIYLSTLVMFFKLWYQKLHKNASFTIFFSINYYCSNNNSIICFIAMQTYKELIIIYIHILDIFLIVFNCN